jgi:hypothetical protein
MSLSWKSPSVKRGLIIFIVMRLFLTIWAVVSLAINPLPEEPDEEIRPYLHEPVLDTGLSGLLLGPWQRFDSQRYLVIAREGYADERHSVFPPLYPLAIRAVGSLFGGSAHSTCTPFNPRMALRASKRDFVFGALAFSMRCSTT